MSAAAVPRKAAPGRAAPGRARAGRARAGNAKAAEKTPGRATPTKAAPKSAAAKAATGKAGAPQRVQLMRSAGWKMPANTLKVDRTTPWGNPFTIADCGSAAIAVAQHGRWMRGEIVAPGGVEPPSREALHAALGGRHLACWCAPNGPCHADLLLILANPR